MNNGVGFQEGWDFVASINKEIANLYCSDNELCFIFTDGDKLVMWDDAEFCCEHRYMVCDDDLSYYIGATLLGAELADGGSSEEDFEYKDCEFLKVITSKGVFTVANYNEHNGCYGGFEIRSRVE